MRKFKLVGPHAGKTISLGGYDFIQGVYTDDSGFVVTEGPDGLLILLARSYNAHPLNSQALRDAEEAYTAAGKAAPAAVDPANQLREAVEGLDPKKDDDWTAQGLPSVDAVSRRAGRAVTRANIETASPGFNRATADALG